jgi:hypothetical protein
MNLQPLFTQPILRQCLFPDVHPGQASDVWLVETRDESVIVRRTRMSSEPANDFWWGCRDLFGVDPTDLFALEGMNRVLGELSPIPVPQVLRKAVVDGVPYVVVEKMPGTTLRSFQSLPTEALVQLGEALARIHSRKFSECGTLSGRLRYPVGQFHKRMAATMRELVQRYYADVPEISILLDEMCAQLLALPPLRHASLIMLDMDPTQFLHENGRITALVDTEVYALGPRELELVALEYLLDKASAAAFVSGYESVLPFPDLRQVRAPYRYFCRLVEVQGPVDIDAWMNGPKWFDEVGSPL